MENEFILTLGQSINCYEKIFTTSIKYLIPVREPDGSGENEG